MLRRAGTPDRAAGEKRYLKSDLDFLGASVWQIRGTVKDFAQRHPDLRHEQVVTLVERLWREPIFEARLSAAFLLEMFARLLSQTDFRLIQRLVRDSKTWALVDVLAGDVLGKIVRDHPDAAAQLDPWIEDRDFWVRRAALLAWLEPLKAGAPFDRFGGYADRLLDEREFFIRKAIGWVLRETSKKRPDEVFAWLEPRARRASTVTLREAIKYLQPEQREALLGGRVAG